MKMQVRLTFLGLIVALTAGAVLLHGRNAELRTQSASASKEGSHAETP